jgi:LacI family transcriptional regulator
MSVTIRDVAHLSGVHISTVSRTFTAPHLVNTETRERVLAAAAKLGYRPNRAARGLITGRTNNIGLIVADIANPFFPPLIKAAESRARQRDHMVFVADSDEDPEVEEDLVQALAKQVDGILLCGPRMDDERIRKLARDVNLVIVNRDIPGLPGVVMDIAYGAHLAAYHLASLGHTAIGVGTGPPNSWASREMSDAVVAELEGSGADVVVMGPNPPTEEGGRRLTGRVVAEGVTAVLTYNDLMAVGLMEGLAEAGVRVPEDVSVAGIDDIPASRLTTPKLTTVATPAAAAGRAAVDLLLSEDDDRDATAQVRLRTELIVRNSTGPVATGRPRDG